jgi:uncharacterized cupin superfamily protein
MGLLGFTDPLTAELEVVGPKAGATAGDPIESVLELSDDGTTSVGIWACTPGSWTSAKDGVSEVMHFVAGHGWITDADGSRHEIRPGLVRCFPDGWSGTWDVDETVHKVYVITVTRPG